MPRLFVSPALAPSSRRFVTTAFASTAKRRTSAPAPSSSRLAQEGIRTRHAISEMFPSYKRTVGTTKSTVAPHRTACSAVARPSEYSRFRRRLLSQSSAASPSESPETVPIVYVEADGTEKRVDAEVGMNLMEVAHANNVELEGACGGELACSTCHLIFPKDVYDTLPPTEDDEVDMLDLAFEVTDTSRLGCQIKVRKDMAGMKVRIPDDGF